MNHSTTIQWTLRLADAALIHDTLRDAARQAEQSADYLEGPRYAEQEQAKQMAKPKEERGAPWTLSTHDLERIGESRAKAARLYDLAEA
jgi:hypothetical protein